MQKGIKKMIICPNPMIDCIKVIGHIIHKKICGSSPKIVACGPFAKEKQRTTQNTEKER